jgi:hypothetical protein
MEKLKKDMKTAQAKLADVSPQVETRSQDYANLQQVRKCTDDHQQLHDMTWNCVVVS